MMKKGYVVLTAGLLSVTLLGACGSNKQASAASGETAVKQEVQASGVQASETESAGEYIGDTSAKSAALKHAGLNEADVTMKKIVLESDDGKMVYDVEFYKGNTEYDYEIDAKDGTVLSFDNELDDDLNDQAPADAIGEEKAKAIALERAELSEDAVSGLYVTYDTDDGVPEYEVQFRADRTEYEVTVHAQTGEVLQFEKDYND